MLETTCHCGAIRICIPAPPEEATICNCSICRRIGGLWAFYPMDEVQITGHPEHSDEYIWGDKTIRTVRCKTCGCATHWEPLVPKPGAKLCVNIRNFEPEVLGDFRVRRFDGAVSWTYLD